MRMVKKIPNLPPVRIQPEEVKVDLNAILYGTDQEFKKKIHSLKKIFSNEVKEDEMCSICCDEFRTVYT